MKKKLLPFLFLIAISFVGKGQTYYPLVKDSLSWTTVSYGDDIITGNIEEFSRTYYGTLGDTIIDDNLYTKLYKSYNNPLNCFDYESSFNTGAMREDSSKKVWFRYLGDSADILLYDFSLELGDTFCFSVVQPSGQSFFEVTEVDSILVDGNYRRRIHFMADTGHEMWVDGVGSLTGLFPEWSLIGNIWSETECFSDQKELVYGAAPFCNCLEPNGIDDQKENLKIEVYPNPSVDNFTVKFRVDKREKAELTIYNLLGQKAYEKALIFNQGVQELQLDAGLTPGIYLMELRINEKTITKKLIQE